MMIVAGGKVGCSPAIGWQVLDESHFFYILHREIVPHSSGYLQQDIPHGDIPHEGSLRSTERAGP